MHLARLRAWGRALTEDVLYEFIMRVPTCSLQMIVSVPLLFVPVTGVTDETSSCPGIHVTVLNIRNDVGTVDCALFDAPKGFPVDVLRSARRLVTMKVPSSKARCDFEDIPAGTYALVVLHDENMNGKLDTNWLGIPKEGYGFSNDAKASLGAPSFDAASFVYDGAVLELTVNLHYR